MSSDREGAGPAPKTASANISEPAAGVSDREVEDIEDRSRLRVPVLYEIVRREGEIEMARPATSLWWSGIAAGLSIGFSLLAQAILYKNLPDTGWRPLVSGFGYSFGFLIVILGRQQLFTENTVTVVLPVAADFTWRNVQRLARTWAIVFAANMVGTLAAALFCSFTPGPLAALHDTMLTLARDMLSGAPMEMFFGGISAGFLMATMVWLIPSAEGAQFHVVTIVTYVIAIGGFPHIVAGSVEAFMLVISGQLGPADMLVGFTIPVLLGNIVGGTVLFAVLSHAQVMSEM